MKKLLVCAALLMFSSGVYAQNFSYNYLQAGYLLVDTDPGVDGDGPGFGGSLGLSPNVALAFEYQDIELDNGVDVTFMTIGVDYHAPIARSTDVVLGIAALEAEIGSEDDTGYVLSAGVRQRLNRDLELGARFAHRDVFDESDTGFGVSLLYGRGPQFIASYETSDDFDTLLFGVRVNF